MNNRCSCLGTFLEHETSEKMKQNLFAHTTPSPPINTTARRTNNKQIKNSVSLRWPKPSHDVKTPKDADVHLGEGGHRKKGTRSHQEQISRRKWQRWMKEVRLQREGVTSSLSLHFLPPQLSSSAQVLTAAAHACAAVR